MTAPQRFRKKPVEIEAMQWNGGLTSNHAAPTLCATKIIDWVLSSGGTARYVNEGEDHPLRYADELYRHRVVKGDRAVAKDAPAFIVIETLEGPHRANPQDQIIRGVQGEFYPCKPDIFEQTYERLMLASAAVPEIPVPDAVRTKATLDAAIQGHARAEWDGDLVVDWILVAGLSGHDGTPSIGVQESRDPMPGYISTGLLTEAINLNGEYIRVDDDDGD